MVSLAGCTSADSGEAPNASSGKKKLVIFSQCNNAEPYRAAQNAAMKRLWGERPDVTLEIMDAQQDNSKQVSQIETAILRRPDLLIVAPNEREPLSDVMGRAVQQGIPVICLERDIAQPNYTTYIRSDNRKIGQLAGQYIVDYLTRKHGRPAGKVVQLSGLKGVEAEANRYGGARDVLSQHPEIEIIANPVADWLQSRARDRMAETLGVHPQIDVVFAHNDAMAVGAYLAAKEVNREKEMSFIGVDGLDGPAGGAQLVSDGVLAATFTYPLCVQEAVEIGGRMLQDPSFQPQAVYEVESTVISWEAVASPAKE